MTIALLFLALLLLSLFWMTVVAPRWITLHHVTCTFADLPTELDSTTLIQLSDLHFSKALTTAQLNRFFSLIENEKPNFVLFTGDFLCYSSPDDLERLLPFLNRFSRFKNCFAILGNHDYKRALGVNPQTGDYDILERKARFFDLFTQKKMSGKMAYRIRGIRPQEALLEILARSPFRLLHNETVTIDNINLTGLGEYSADDCKPEKAYENFAKGVFGITLVHNPDAVPSLLEKPSQLFLSGHTHGAQINLPFFWNFFTRIEHPEYKRGIVPLKDNKLLFVSRGMWSCLPVRIFSRPEITKITLRCR